MPDQKQNNAGKGGLMGSSDPQHPTANTLFNLLAHNDQAETQEQ